MSYYQVASGVKLPLLELLVVKYFVLLNKQTNKRCPESMVERKGQRHIIRVKSTVQSGDTENSHFEK